MKPKRWQKLTAATVAETIATYLIITGAMDATTWAWFTVGNVGIFAGGNVGEHFATKA